MNDTSECLNICHNSCLHFIEHQKVVAKHTPSMRKEAGRMPQVGLLGSGEMVGSALVDDEWSQLSSALSKSSKRMF